MKDLSHLVIYTPFSVPAMAAAGRSHGSSVLNIAGNTNPPPVTEYGKQGCWWGAKFFERQEVRVFMQIKDCNVMCDCREPCVRL
jgi:hypothetical protein